jgi:single-strand DNA-binding protein
MKSVNKVFLLGHLTRDPELKRSEGKKPVCIFGLATNRNWTTETGEKREETEFHRIIAWDKLAETCYRRLQTRPYTGQDGIEKHATEIVLEELTMLDKMPEQVKDTLELQDALQGDGAPAQQV